jgi:hypothetical protein
MTFSPASSPLREVEPVVDAQEIAAKISQALDVATRWSSDETVENYNVLGEMLAELESSAGHFLRAHSAYQFLVTKLQQGGPLTADDLKTLRSLIVGDADEYLKYDDDFAQSKTQLGKILDQIRQMQSDELSPETLMRLRVLCREATSALVPTVHYLEQKQRVRNFDEHTRGPLSADARRMLSGAIRDMVG